MHRILKARDVIEVIHGNHTIENNLVHILEQNVGCRLQECILFGYTCAEVVGAVTAELIRCKST